MSFEITKKELAIKQGEQSTPLSLIWTESNTSIVKDKVNEILSDKLAYVTLEQFGAIGDGVTDDTQAFIYASAEGKIIKLTDKSFAINRALTLNNTVFVGSSNSKIIIGNMAVHFNGDTTFKNINFESEYLQFGLTGDDGGNVLLDNCNFKNTYMHFYNPNTVTITNCIFDTDDDIPNASKKYEYIHIANEEHAWCEKIIVDNCRFLNSPTDAFDIYPNGDHVYMSNCSFIDCDSVSEIKCGNETVIKRNDIKFENIYIELKQDKNGFRCYDQEIYKSGAETPSEYTPSAIFDNINVLYKFNDESNLVHSGYVVKVENSNALINNLKVLNDSDFNGTIIGGNNNARIQANNITSKSNLLVICSSGTVQLTNCKGRAVQAINLNASNCEFDSITHNATLGYIILLSNCTLNNNFYFLGGKIIASNCNLKAVRNNATSGICLISNSITNNPTIPSDNDYFKSNNLVYIA